MTASDRVRSGRRPPRRLLLALAAGAVVFSATLGSAAGLPLGSGLGVGSTPVSSCNSGPVAARYHTMYSNRTGYTVTSVTLTGIDAIACAGTTVQVTLTDAAGAALASGSAPEPGTGDTVTMTLIGTARAMDVARISIAIG